MQTLSVDRLVGQVLGNYRVEQLLGRGRLNAVFLAQNVATQSQGALTLFTIPENFSSEARTRFLRRFHKASAALVALRHDHILPVYEGGEYLGYPFLVTPYMMNGSLADIVKRKGRLSYERVRDMLEQIVAGLEYAHKKGIIHGTLKPSNIVLSTKQTMLVAGFGLMHIQQMRGVERSDQPYGHLMSVANTLLVAPEYIAPEIVEGQYIDKRSDVYALGAILFELLSGRPPFTGSDPLTVIKQHVEQAIPSLRSLCSDVPVALESVVNQALERDPARRFQSAGELAEAFDQVSRGATGALYNLPAGKTKPSSSRPAEQFLQETSEETTTGGITGKNWQFTPPIVTGKMPAFKPAAKQELPPAASTQSRPRTRQNDSRSAPPRIAAEQIPATGSGTRSSSRGIQKQQRPVVEEQQEMWSEPGIVQTEDIQFSAPIPAMPSQPRKAETTEDIRFSAPLPTMQPRKTERREDDMEPLVRPSRSQPRKNEADDWWQQSSPMKQGMQLPTEIDDLWSPTPMTGTLRNTRSLQGKKPARGVSRRSVVALLAAGGVAAAVGIVAVNNGRLMQMASGAMQQANTPKNDDGTTNKGNQGTQQGKNNPAGGTQQQNGGKTANVIGTTTLAANSSAVFTNPTDKKDSVLVHLSNGNFVAYERACTHVQVNVNYDPATQLLVCPAHGAIFDPAKSASVVQGPNGAAPTSIKPLTKVPIQVKSDGTITTV
jgi:serine/threonine protein kinase/Rieske Fe-S protein